MEIKISSLEEIDNAAHAFLKALGSQRIVAFYGQMGAGKTTFTRALCEAVGVTEPVTSPTFAIVNEYEAPALAPVREVYHFDFYRIKRLEEAYDLGFEDYLYSGALCIIEWPELIEELLPEETMRVHILINEDGTRILRW